MARNGVPIMKKMIIRVLTNGIVAQANNWSSSIHFASNAIIIVLTRYVMVIIIIICVMLLYIIYAKICPSEYFAKKVYKKLTFATEIPLANGHFNNLYDGVGKTTYNAHALLFEVSYKKSPKWNFASNFFAYSKANFFLSGPIFAPNNCSAA